MKFHIILTILILIYIHPIEALIWYIKQFLGLNQAVEPTLPRNYPPLPLLLVTSRKCVIAPIKISTILKEWDLLQLDQPSNDKDEITVTGTQFLYTCPAENGDQDKTRETSMTGQSLFIRNVYTIMNTANPGSKVKTGGTGKDENNALRNTIDVSTEFLDGGKTIEKPKSTNKVALDGIASDPETRENILESVPETIVDEENTAKRKNSNDPDVPLTSEPNKTMKLMEKKDGNDEDVKMERVQDVTENTPLLDNQKIENSDSKEIALTDPEEGYKCLTKVKPSFLNYTELGHKQPPYTVYITGYEVYMGDEYQHVFTYTPDDMKIHFKPKFHWFNVLTILFDGEKLDTRCVSYCEVYRRLWSPSDHINSGIESDYQLGKATLYGDLDIAKLYELENQRNVFSAIFPDEAEMINYFDGDKKILVKAHLAPLNVFETPSVDAVLTYGNIAPMWSVVKSNSWHNVETFINELITVFKGLHVVTGTYDVLSLNSRGPVYLGDEQVSVPLAFYKIVDYPVEKDNSYYMVIVVMNNPYEASNDVICPVNKCINFGWGKIATDDYKRGKTYCCPLTKEIIKLLNIEQRVTDGGVLDLYRFISTAKYKQIFG